MSSELSTTHSRSFTYLNPCDPHASSKGPSRLHGNRCLEQYESVKFSTAVLLNVEDVFKALWLSCQCVSQGV